MRSTKAIISLAAIKHNLTVLKSLAPSSKVVVVIKANAYGHGAVEVARYLKDEVCFGVAIIDEALELRKAGIDASILVLEGALGSDELDLALDNDLELVVQNSQQLQKILDKAADYSGNKKLNVWLKFNSGMNRLGFASSDYLSIYQQLAECSLVAKITAISHLACADNINDPTTQAQLDQFKLVTKDLPVEKSFANSAGIIAWPEVHFDWIRPGLALYGCSPMAGNMTGESHNLKPAMTLVSKLISIRKVSKGVAVGYSCGWVAERDTRIGVVAIGYADGYPRHISQGSPVLINGKRYSVVGSVCMDMLTVDLGVDDTIELDDKVILWGEGLPLDEVAKNANTIPHTLMCAVTSRVKYEWLDD